VVEDRCIDSLRHWLAELAMEPIEVRGNARSRSWSSRSSQEECMSPFTIRPPDSRVRAYRAAGVWRDYGSIGYLRRWRDETPQALAVSAFGPADAPVQLSYRAYARLVERFSGALYELGVRPGHVVAVQLPNWWQALVLF